MVTSCAIVEPQTRCSAEFRMCPDDQVCDADGALLCRAALPSPVLLHVPRTSLGVTASCWPQALLKNELETMRLVSLHPGVPTLHRSYDDKDHTMFVMDFVRGGPLLDQIVQQRTFTENDARATFHSALRTLNFMAKIGVVHRDLKVRRCAGFWSRFSLSALFVCHSVVLGFLSDNVTCVTAVVCV